MIAKAVATLRRAACLAANALAVLGFSILMAGCAGVGQSLQLTNAVLVKVPGPIEFPDKDRDRGNWHFRHVLEGPREGQGKEGRVNHWYVVWNDLKQEHKPFYKPYWSVAFEETPAIMDATWHLFQKKPLLIEPNHTFQYKVVARDDKKPAADPTVKPSLPGSREVAYRNLTTPVWPDVHKRAEGHTRDEPIDPFWYRGDKYTELEAARVLAGSPRDGQRIRIGHLDNGFDGSHPAAPKYLIGKDRRSNVYGLLKYAEDKAKGVARERQAFTEDTRGTHGMGTIGLLAGGQVHLPPLQVHGETVVAGYDGYVGGAPEAEVYPMRIAPWVASLSTGELAYAIDRASRIKHCDVISMSHGGSPSQTWVDAVNAAYDRGTAMVAAESDFLSLSFDPLPVLGLVLPSSPVYPAAFRRVLGVTGVTADNRSYGRNRLSRLLGAPPIPANLGDWAFRGSYGADGTSTVFFRPQNHPDGSELKRGGPLRPQPIAAYSPNIPWLAVNYQDGAPTKYVVDLDGAGTSASTPQVAAAAALWLQKHRHEFSPREWQGWQKPEAVYCALLSTAYLPGDPARPDPFLGAGILKAKRALGVSYRRIKLMQRTPGVSPCDQTKTDPGRGLYFAKSGRDHFDAQRSFVALLGFDSLRNLPYDQRADLYQDPMPGAEPDDELRRFYYNALLLRAWQGGHLPDKHHGEDRLWMQAQSAAAKTRKLQRQLGKAELLQRVARLCPRPPDDPCRYPAHPSIFPPDGMAGHDSGVRRARP